MLALVMICIALWLTIKIVKSIYTSLDSNLEKLFWGMGSTLSSLNLNWVKGMLGWLTPNSSAKEKMKQVRERAQEKADMQNDSWSDKSFLKKSSWSEYSEEVKKAESKSTLQELHEKAKADYSSALNNLNADLNKQLDAQTVDIDNLQKANLDWKDLRDYFSSEDREGNNQQIDFSKSENVKKLESLLWVSLESLTQGDDPYIELEVNGQKKRFDKALIKSMDNNELNRIITWLDQQEKSTVDSEMITPQVDQKQTKLDLGLDEDEIKKPLTTEELPDIKTLERKTDNLTEGLNISSNISLNEEETPMIPTNGYELPILGELTEINDMINLGTTSTLSEDQMSVFDSLVSKLPSVDEVAPITWEQTAIPGLTGWDVPDKITPLVESMSDVSAKDIKIELPESITLNETPKSDTTLLEEAKSDLQETFEKTQFALSDSREKEELKNKLNSLEHEKSLKEILNENNKSSNELQTQLVENSKEQLNLESSLSKGSSENEVNEKTPLEVFSETIKTSIKDGITESSNVLTDSIKKAEVELTQDQSYLDTLAQQHIAQEKLALNDSELLNKKIEVSKEWDILAAKSLATDSEHQEILKSTSAEQAIQNELAIKANSTLQDLEEKKANVERTHLEAQVWELISNQNQIHDLEMKESRENREDDLAIQEVTHKEVLSKQEQLHKENLLKEEAEKAQQAKLAAQKKEEEAARLQAQQAESQSFLNTLTQETVKNTVENIKVEAPTIEPIKVEIPQPSISQAQQSQPTIEREVIRETIVQQPPVQSTSQPTPQVNVNLNSWQVAQEVKQAVQEGMKLNLDSLSSARINQGHEKLAQLVLTKLTEQNKLMMSMNESNTQKMIHLNSTNISQLKWMFSLLQWQGLGAEARVWIMSIMKKLDTLEKWQINQPMTQNQLASVLGSELNHLLK